MRQAIRSYEWRLTLATFTSPSSARLTLTLGAVPSFKELERGHKSNRRPSSGFP